MSHVFFHFSKNVKCVANFDRGLNTLCSAPCLSMSVSVSVSLCVCECVCECVCGGGDSIEVSYGDRLIIIAVSDFKWARELKIYPCTRTH